MKKKYSGSFDERLVNLFNEYVHNDAQDDFETMLYAYWMAITEEKRKAEREIHKAQIDYAKQIKDTMTPEEKVRFLNTPYEDMPDDLKVGMTQNPQVLNFIRMSHPNIGNQKDTFAARLVKFKAKYGMTNEEICNLTNQFAKKFDIKKTKKRKGQYTRVKPWMLDEYEDYNITPKIDKLTALSEAMGFSIDYFAGYGPDNRRSKVETLEAKYRKRRGGNNETAAIPV